LIKQVTSISTAFQQSGASSGVLKVSLRKEAWAKSHRPQRALFPPSKRPCIAVSNLEELYYHVTADDVRELASEARQPKTRLADALVQRQIRSMLLRLISAAMQAQ
jgi:hypothetical protein